MYRSWLISLLCVLFAFQSFGQQENRISKHSETNHEFSAGFVWHPRGIGGNLKIGSRRTERIWRFAELDLVQMKHPKEFKIRSSAFSTPGSYTYGKLNHTYFLRLGVGAKYELARKIYKNTISTDLSFSIGPSFALLKPVYLDIFYTSPDNQSGYLVSEKYDPNVHTNQNRIFGNSGFSRGLNETKAQAGLYLKSSITFDWGDYADMVQSVELGGVVDLFPKEVPIMALIKNKKVFTSLYICFNIGNRW